MFKILFLSLSLFFVLSVHSVCASTEIRQEDLSYDYVYFGIENSPYYVKEEVSFKINQEIKIDDKVVFIFEEGSGLCAPSGDCIKGEWKFKDGLAGHRIKMSSDFHATIKPYDGYIEYFVNTFPKIKKKMGFGLLSFYYPVLFLDSQEVDSNLRADRVIIYLTEILGDSINRPLTDFSTKTSLSTEEEIGIEEEKQKEVLEEDVSVEDIVFEDEKEQALQEQDDYLEKLNEEKVSDLEVNFFKEKKLSNDFVSGKIFLEVEKNGEAWYVYPNDGLRYYLGRPADAFNIMREKSLGVKHDFITSYSVYPERVLGMILLDIEDNGKAYYIDPRDKRAYYLGRPEDAFAVMRDRGIGISNDDIMRIPTRY